MKVDEVVKRKIADWEYKNLVWGTGYVDKNKGSGGSLVSNMRTRGYDAMRVSPRVTTKFGLKYRAVYGGQVEPIYSMPVGKNRYRAKVNWWRQGFIRAGLVKKGGTKVLHNMNDYPVDKASLKSQLMMR